MTNCPQVSPVSRKLMLELLPKIGQLFHQSSESYPGHQVLGGPLSRSYPLLTWIEWYSVSGGWLSSIGKYWVVLSCIRKALLPLEISRLCLCVCLSFCSLDHVTSSHQYDQSLKRSDTLLGFVGWNIRMRL